MSNNNTAEPLDLVAVQPNPFPFRKGMAKTVFYPDNNSLVFEFSESNFSLKEIHILKHRPIRFGFNTSQYSDEMSVSFLDTKGNDHPLFVYDFNVPDYHTAKLITHSMRNGEVLVATILITDSSTDFLFVKREHKLESQFAMLLSQRLMDRHDNHFCDCCEW